NQDQLSYWAYINKQAFIEKFENVFGAKLKSVTISHATLRLEGVIPLESVRKGFRIVFFPVQEPQFQSIEYDKLKSFEKFIDIGKDLDIINRSKVILTGSSLKFSVDIQHA